MLGANHQTELGDPGAELEEGLEELRGNATTSSSAGWTTQCPREGGYWRDRAGEDKNGGMGPQLGNSG